MSYNAPASIRRALWLAASLTTGLLTLSPAENVPTPPFTPWKQPSHRLRLEEVMETLRYWSERHPEIMSLEERGRSSSGLPLMLARFSDPGVPDDAKQVLLVTALHAGAERSGATSAMHFIEWLLSGDPLVKETLRKQIVLVMPVMNPHGLTVESNGNEAKHDPYSAGRGNLWDVPALKLKDPAVLPEAQAFINVVDEYQPEVHVDLHGVSIGWKGMETPETAGPAGSNVALRPWDSRFDERLTRAAHDAGYGIYRMEMDEERLQFPPQAAAHAHALWWGRPFFYTGTYAYLKYHTLPVTMEITWEESALARLKEVLRIGNGTWPTENRPGYPVNVIASNGLNQLVAWGRTPGERRKSRLELWQRQASLPMGSLAPKADGRILFLGMLTSKGAAQVDQARFTDSAAPAGNEPKMPDFLTKEALLRLAETAPNLDGRSAIKDFIAAGPETRLVLNWTGIQPKPPLGEPLQHGLAYRSRIPYKLVAFHHVRLNGRTLKEGEALGYETWYADGFTHLKINIPPEHASQLDLALVECSFTPTISRSQGWTPPAEVRERLKKKTP